MNIFTVSQVTTYLRESMEQDPLLNDVWVNGEISNYSRSTAGHMYFTLKDDSAQIRCVLFRGDAAKIEIRDGEEVSAHGHLSLYQVRGDLQLYVDSVRKTGIGEQSIELQRLKEKLEKDGLFDPQRKRPLPRFPKRIGVVTSPTGAVWHDIRNVVQRRYPIAELVLSACQVQGVGAAETIVSALSALATEEGIEVIILARGGGSQEELWPFNEEPVARAVYASRSPVISAIGHETDITVVDLVADLRAATPSVAAEYVVPDTYELMANINEQCDILYSAVIHGISVRHEIVWALLRQLEMRVPDLDNRQQKVDGMLHDVEMALTNVISLSRSNFQGIQELLTSLEPSEVLRRGYAIVTKKQSGDLVVSPTDVSSADKLRIRLHKGELTASVDKGGKD